MTFLFEGLKERGAFGDLGKTGKRLLLQGIAMRWGNSNSENSWGNSGWGNNNCGNSWGSKGWGNNNWGNSWGNSGWGGSSSSENTKVAEGTHWSDCIAGSSGLGGNEWNSSYYQSNCSGCNHARAAAPWGGSRENGVLNLLGAVGVITKAKKSTLD
ncbi:hypothetical protein DPMN_174591 [Dreissena polymorpha]|uniref:Uncharacterized protein n=1 Tax=Dreissena polymorpha TaxID=45954 RepID=A0A9D4E5M4_DREPO|nr:hypothetical protein DPMN_174591 [Dreissena polymorpha]